MHIAFIAGEYPPLEGGLGAYTRELARALVPLGHQVSVFTRAAPDAPAEEEDGGIQEDGGIPKDGGIHVSRGVLGSGWGSKSFGSLLRFLRARKPDVLNLQYQAGAYGKYTWINLLPRLIAPRIPVVVTFHDLKAPYLFPKAGAFRRRAVLDMARCASGTVVTNVEDRATLQQEHIRRVYMIPIGSNITPISLMGFDRAAWLRARAVRPESRVVGYFGFMNESKGGETLVRALAELRHMQMDVTLLLIGGQTGASDPTNADYANFIMHLAEELGVSRNISLTGFLNDQGVSEALASCDCVALPYRDGASFRRGTLMAALAHGCAIVTTNPRVNIPELEDRENVVLAVPDNPPALTEAIRTVLTNEQLRVHIQTGAKQLSEQFGWEGIATQMTSVFQHVKR